MTPWPGQEKEGDGWDMQGTSFVEHQASHHRDEKSISRKKLCLIMIWTISFLRGIYRSGWVISARRKVFIIYLNSLKVANPPKRTFWRRKRAHCVKSLYEKYMIGWQWKLPVGLREKRDKASKNSFGLAKVDKRAEKLTIVFKKVIEVSEKTIYVVKNVIETSWNSQRNHFKGQNQHQKQW